MHDASHREGCLYCICTRYLTGSEAGDDESTVRLAQTDEGRAQIVRSLLEPPAGSKPGKGGSHAISQIAAELPGTDGDAAKCEAFLQSFAAPLKLLVEVNLPLAQRLGRGVAILRATQITAKKLGEIMFAERCSDEVSRFLEELTGVVREMLAKITLVQADMEKLRRDMADDMGLKSGTKKSNLDWERNIMTASDLVKLASTNMEAVTGITERIRSMTAETEHDVPRIIEEWKKNVANFCGGVPGGAEDASMGSLTELNLPQGWEIRESRSGGEIYYLNTLSGTTQFGKPRYVHYARPCNYSHMFVWRLLSGVGCMCTVAPRRSLRIGARWCRRARGKSITGTSRQGRPHGGSSGGCSQRTSLQSASTQGTHYWRMLWGAP